MFCFKELIWASRILQAYIKCSGVCAPSLQGHVGLSVNLNLCKYDLVFPWPVTIAVNSGVMGSFTCSLCSTAGKNDLHNAPFAVRSHCLCHFTIPSFFSSEAAVVVLQLVLLCCVYTHGYEQFRTHTMNPSCIPQWTTRLPRYRCGLRGRVGCVQLAQQTVARRQLIFAHLVKGAAKCS